MASCQRSEALTPGRPIHLMMTRVSRKVPPAFVRSAVLVVGLVVSAALGRPGTEMNFPRPAVDLPPPRAFESGFGFERLAAGQRAAELGELAAADSAYRVAWSDPLTRQRAAAALTELHRTPGFGLLADEDALARARTLLGFTFQRYDT